MSMHPEKGRVSPASARPAQRRRLTPTTSVRASLVCSILLGGLASAAAAGVQAAPLWAVDHRVARVGEVFTVDVWLLGDGLTHGADARVLIPPEFRVRATRGSSDGLCALRPGVSPQVVSIITTPAATALPAALTRLCSIDLAAESAVGAWLRIADETCVDARGGELTCEVGHGYVLVRP